MSVLSLAPPPSPAGSHGRFTLGHFLFTATLRSSSNLSFASFIAFNVKNAALRPLAMAVVGSFEDMKPSLVASAKAGGVVAKKDVTGSVAAEVTRLILVKENSADLELMLCPWFERVHVEEWNRIISGVGRKDWTLALEVFSLVKRNIDVVLDSTPEDAQMSSCSCEGNGSLTDKVGLKSTSLLKMYTTVLTVLAQHRRIKEGETLVREAKLEGLSRDLFFFNAELGLYGSAGMVKHASEIMKEMKRLGIEPDRITYEMLIAAQLNKSKGSVNLPAALQVLSAMVSKDLRPGFRTFADLIKACWEASQADKADAVFSAMIDAGHKPDVKVWIKMLQIHGRKGNYVRAEELFQLLRSQGCPVVPSLYEHLLLAYCKAGRLAQAFSVMRESKLTGKPSMMAYNILIDACAKLKLHAEAWQLFVDVRNSGLKPNVIMYTSVITALVKGGMYEKAEELYKRMQADNVSPNIYTYTSMIHAYTLRGWTRFGDEVCMSMKSSGCCMNLASYGAMLHLYLLGGWYGHAAKVLKEMEQHGHEPDAAGYGVLFAACGEMGNEIAPLRKSLRTSKWGACRAVHTLIFSAENDLKMATEPVLPEDVSLFLKSYAETKDQGTNLSLHNALMDALWRKGLRKRAQLLMVQARNLLPWYKRPTRRESEHFLDLRGLSIGGAQVAVLDWLSEVASTKEEFKMIIITGKGAPKNELKLESGVKSAVTATLRELGSPFTEDPQKRGCLHATTSDVIKWLSMPGIGTATSLLDALPK